MKFLGRTKSSLFYDFFIIFIYTIDLLQKMSNLMSVDRKYFGWAYFFKANAQLFVVYTIVIYWGKRLRAEELRLGAEFPAPSAENEG